MSYTAQQNQAKATKAMGEYNNKLAQQAAENKNAEAAEQANRMRVEKRRALAEINAQTAASGAVMEGSPLAVLGETSRRHEINIADTMRNAQIEAQQTLREGELNLWESKEKARGLKLSSYGTLLSGAADLMKIGMDYDNTKANRELIALQKKALQK